jgi:hypothetical protein
MLSDAERATLGVGAENRRVPAPEPRHSKFVAAVLWSFAPNQRRRIVIA